MKKEDKKLTIVDKIILGALKCSEGDTNKPFTFGDLVIATWELDKFTFGLRGYEEKYPATHKIHPNLYGNPLRGLIESKSGQAKTDELLCITEAGLSRALSLNIKDVSSFKRLVEHLRNAIIRILEHSTFKKWLIDPTQPKDFREAAYFWGISPGTPSKIVRDRLLKIEKTIKGILDYFEKTGLDSMRKDRVNGKILFERKDVERCLEFHKEMKSRFKKELKILDPDGKY